MAASFEELVIDNEICRSVLAMAQGIKVDDETMALDIIHKVSPGGHFLAEKHTLQHFTEEHIFSELADKSSYEAWKKAGAKSLVEMAGERAKEILKEHQPTPLDKDVQKEISDIIRRAESELAKGSS